MPAADTLRRRPSTGPLTVRVFGDPVLRERAREVVTFDGVLRKLGEDMLATMFANEGVGLAANQVGVLRRVFTCMTHRDDEQGTVMVNPEVVEVSEEAQEGDEGCLSLPGLFYPTERPLRALVAAQGTDGEPFEIAGEGTLARIVLHEVDHLNGVLFIDHLARHDRGEAMRRIRQGELDGSTGRSS